MLQFLPRYSTVLKIVGKLLDGAHGLVDDIQGKEGCCTKTCHTA